MKRYSRLSAPAFVVSALLVCDIACHFVGAQETPQVPQVITAQQFRLVSPEGKILATLSSQNDDANFSLFGADGKRRVELKGGSEGETSFTLNNKSGQPLLRLLDSDDTPQILLLNKKGELRTSFSLSSDDTATFCMYGPGKQRQVKLFATPSQVSLFDSSGNARALMYLGIPGEKPAFSILNKDGKSLWQAPPQKR